MSGHRQLRLYRNNLDALPSTQLQIDRFPKKPSPRLAESSQYQESYYYCTQGSSSPEPFHPHSPPGKILLIEDSEIVLQAHQQFLRQLGYRTTLARNGQTALALLDDSFSGIILDLGLPDIDGISLCRLIREREKKGRIPLMVLTVCNESFEGECRRAGADLFVSKPLPTSQLARMLEKLGL